MSCYVGSCWGWSGGGETPGGEEGEEKRGDEAHGGVELLSELINESCQLNLMICGVADLLLGESGGRGR